MNIDPNLTFGHPEYGIPGDFSSKPLDLTLSEDFTNNNEFTLKSPFAKSDSSFKPPPLSGSPTRQQRAQSDVHSMVARFDTLQIRDPEEARKKQAAALKRAQMGREEAEADAKRVREELREAKSDVESYKSREQRLMKRVDSMTDELHRSKETQTHAQTLYEKEIRKTRKEAFRASSSLVKLQEELKAARNMLRTLQSDLDLEKAKATRREQEAFTSQYQLVGVQEDLADARARLKVVEEEREALKMSLKEEEVARIAAEGRIALPVAVDEDDEFASPRKTRRSDVRRSLSPPKMMLSPDIQAANEEEVEMLREEVWMQRRRRDEAEDIIRHMRLECQFGCCSCKLAEQQEMKYVHDGSFEAELMRINSAVKGMLTPSESVVQCDKDELELMDLGDMITEETPAEERMLQPPTQKEEVPAHADEIMTDTQWRPSSSLPSTTQPPPPPQAEATSTQTSPRASPPHNPSQPENQQYPQNQPEPQPPQTPSPTHQPFKTSTTTTAIPLADPERTNNPHPDFSLFATPTGLTREQAIEQLRARRGRAKSVALNLSSSLNLASSLNASLGSGAGAGGMGPGGAGMTPATTGKRVGGFGAGVNGEEVQTPRREFSAPEMGKSGAGLRSVSRSVARNRVVSK